MGPPVQFVLEGGIERPTDEELAVAAEAAADVFLRAHGVEPAIVRKPRPTVAHRKPRRSADWRA